MSKTGPPKQRPGQRQRPDRRRRVVLVTGLSGAGKASILRALEDLDFVAVDNPPLPLLPELAAGSARNLAVGVDARTQGFDAGALLDILAALRRNPRLRPSLVYAWADEATLLRRYTETRRRHPMAPRGRVVDGIAAEQQATARLRDWADLAIDTSELPLSELRAMIEQAFGEGSEAEGRAGLLVALISFAYPCGLPREADLVFDTRFLRNPHYDPILRPRTGFDPEVAAYVAADPDNEAFFGQITSLLSLLLPRFVREGKKYASIAIGCTGGRHRSVYLVERLAAFLAEAGWRLHVTHRELARGPAYAGTFVPGARSTADLPARLREEASDQPPGSEARLTHVQAQEA